jgi:phosphoesterase RecJ-like protein
VGLEKVVAAVKKHKRFLITSHTNPEGDALGAELAFYFLVKELGKEAVIVNEDDLPYGYDFLPGKGRIIRYGRQAREVDFDCLAVLDCSDLERTGEVYRLNASGKPVINIDHHISNELFGDENLVDPHASSTCEMIYRLYRRMKIPVSRDAAICLYTGLIADTGSFRFSNTTSLTHRIASDLLKHDFSVPFIYRNIYENIPYQDMRLLSRILPGMHRESAGRIIWFEIPHRMLRHKKLCFDLSEHVLSFGRSIKDVEVVVLFKENLGVRNEIRVNFRSNGALDVNKVAAHFGGGGHRTASGATVRGKLADIRRKVLAKIKENLK